MSRMGKLLAVGILISSVGCTEAVGPALDDKEPEVRYLQSLSGSDAVKSLLQNLEGRPIQEWRINTHLPESEVIETLHAHIDGKLQEPVHPIFKDGGEVEILLWTTGVGGNNIGVVTILDPQGDDGVITHETQVTIGVHHWDFFDTSWGQTSAYSSHWELECGESVEVSSSSQHSALTFGDTDFKLSYDAGECEEEAH